MAFNSENIEEFHDIWVFCEQREGKLQNTDFELISEGRKLADERGAKLIGVLLGSDVKDIASELGGYGADKVIVCDDPSLKVYTTDAYCKVLCDVVMDKKPEVLLIGATTIGRDLAPRVAGRVGTGLTADCTGLSVDPETKLFRMTRPAFGGNIMATILIKEKRPQMATVRPGVMKLGEKCDATGKKATMVPSVLEPSDMNVEILEIIPKDTKSVDITEAKVLVSGGRAVGGPEGYEPLRELAAVLGGEVSSSRIGVDNGWIEKDRQVGQTGKTVRPQLYMACGISGAIQHLAGMENSDFIIAINKDATCPMMQLADLGVEGDIKKIIPKLTEAVTKLKESRVVDK